MDNEMYSKLLARVDEMVTSRVDQIASQMIDRIVERRITAMRAEGLQGLTDQFIAALLLSKRGRG